MTDATCCPLSGCDDGNHPEVFTSRRIKAAKDHRCRECDETIPKGAVHELDKGIWDGRWDSIRTCLSCVEIRNHFACGNGWVYGQLWYDLEENFFPDMRAGGPCLDGLSPAGKARMFEMRLAWVLSHDEYLPCDLATPPGYVAP